MKLLPYLVFILVYYIVRAMVVAPANRDFYLAFLNVGQGDGIFINSPGYGAFMVDTGPNYQANYLSARRSVFPICHIKTVFITHYDLDHVGGLDRIRRYCKDVDIKDNLSRNDYLTLGGVQLNILAPPKKNLTHEENDDSIVMLLSFGNFRALLTGDAGIAALERAFSGLSGPVDVYKVSHHGSKYNTSSDLVSKLKPKVCVISVGKNNFGHPSINVLRDLASIGCRIYRTDLDGTVVLY